MAEPHIQGVYFHSCYLGNLLLLENGKLGLIDVLDIRFRNGRLTTKERERNFKCLRSRSQDHARLDAIWEPMMNAYHSG